MSDRPEVTSDAAERPVPRISARAQRRRGEILRAAHEVFTTKGFRNGSLGDIADRVGITHQGILHYFGSKEQLLVEVLRDRDAVGRLQFETAERPRGVDFLHHVLRTVEENVSRTGIVQAYTVLSAESVTEEHPAQGWFRDRFDVLRAELAEALRVACAAAEPTAEPTAGPTAGPTAEPAAEPAPPTAEQLDRGASALIAVMDGLQVQWLLDPDAVDMPAVVRMTVDALLRSWGRPPLAP